MSVVAHFVGLELVLWLLVEVDSRVVDGALGSVIQVTRVVLVSHKELTLPINILNLIPGSSLHLLNLARRSLHKRILQTKIVGANRNRVCDELLLLLGLHKIQLLVHKVDHPEITRIECGESQD